MGTREGTCWADTVREWEDSPATVELPSDWAPRVRLTANGEGWGAVQREWDESAYAVTAVLP